MSKYLNIPRAGILDVQMKHHHNGDDQLSFDDFESLYTNSEGFAGFEGDESTNMVEEHLEPVVVEDTDFGDLPTPSGVSGLDSLSNDVVPDFYEAFSQADAESSLAEDPSAEPFSTELPRTYVHQGGTYAQPVEDGGSEVVVSEVVVDEVAEFVVSTVAESGVVEEFEPEEGGVREASMISDGFEVATHHGETPAAMEDQVVEEVSDEELDVKRSQDLASDSANPPAEKDEDLPAPAELHVEDVVIESHLTSVCLL